MSTPSGRAVAETLTLFGVVYILQGIAYFVGTAQALTVLFILSAPLSENPWTIVTSVYAHGSIGHLVANSVTLIVVGWPVARATTRLRFHAFFITTGAIAGSAQIFVTESLATVTGAGGAAGVLGASGAVFALMGYLVAGNRVSDNLAARIEVPIWLAAIVFLVLATVVTIATAAPQVALVAHFTGFFIGLVAGRLGVLDLPHRPRE